MLKSSSVAFALVVVSVLGGCTEAPMSSEELAAEPELGQSEDALCSNGDGVNSVMAALAASAAKELGRWSPKTDFATSSSPWSLVLTSTGKARCADGKCWNTQAILDLQKAPPNTVKFGTTVLNANNLVSQLVARYNEQLNCELRGGTGASNCSAEQHKLVFKSQAPGACDTVFTYNATSPTGGALAAPAQLKNKLIFVGGTSNPYLSFSSTGTTVSIDPTYGLDDYGSTTTGACTAACTKMSLASMAGSCCSCNGATKKYSKAAWNPTTFLCL